MDYPQDNNNEQIKMWKTIEQKQNTNKINTKHKYKTKKHKLIMKIFKFVY